MGKRLFQCESVVHQPEQLLPNLSGQALAYLGACQIYGNVGHFVRQGCVYDHESLSFQDSYVSHRSSGETGQAFQSSSSCGGRPVGQGLGCCPDFLLVGVFLAVNGKSPLGQVPELDGRGLYSPFADVSGSMMILRRSSWSWTGPGESAGLALMDSSR